jgi:gamma-glutamyltranspeptidase/glutathione hydrolase
MTPTFDWNAGYNTRRLPVFARNVVSTSQPLASQAGLRMIYNGGNAVDAAIATAAVMAVVEPCSNGLGSDAFIILWDGKKLHGLNASGTAPKAWTPQYIRQRHAENGHLMPVRGWDTVTVPGAVSAWVALSKRFGKLPFADLLAPAIEVAERGYGVTQVVQQKWELASQVKDLVSQPGFKETFLPRGRVPQVGELFRFESAARGLRAIAESKGESFYRGEMAEALVRAAQAQGGAMTLADMAAYQPEWVTPLAKDYRGHTLHEIPPNGQGIAAQIALGILSNFDLAGMACDSAEAAHLQIEAMKLAFADITEHVADLAAMRVTPEQLLDPGYLRKRAALIDLKKAQDFKAGNPIKGGTIYLTAADESGMMVSFIQSNYMGFGSGVVEPTFGISLQNRGHGFSMNPDSPNIVAPGKRPLHTILPAFLTQGGEPVMSFGVMGGNMQPQGHLQTLVRMLDFKQNPQAACDAPRWRYSHGLTINAEAAMDPAIVSGLADRGHRMDMIQDSYQDFGAGQFIWRLGNPGVEGYVAASDPRRDGHAAGW